MSDTNTQNQKSLKSRVSDELNALRKQEIAKNRRGKFKDEGSTFLTPEEAQTYLADLRTQKKNKVKPTPPTNLPSAELNDWFTRQKRMQLEEQEKRIEAEKFLRGYRSKLDHVKPGSANSSSPRRRTKSENSVEVDGIVITDEAIDNVMDEVHKLNHDASTETDQAEPEDEADADVAEEVKEIQEEEEEVKEEEVEAKNKDEPPPSINGNDQTDVVDDEVPEEYTDEKEAKVETQSDEPTLIKEEEEEGVSNEEKDDETSLVEKEETTAAKEDDDEDTEKAIERAEGTDETVEEIQKDDANADVVQEEIVASKKEEKNDAAAVDEETEDKDDSPYGMVERHDSFVNIEEKEPTDVPDTEEESWRDMISSEPGAKFPPEANRYHLYVSHACPWAHRTVIVLALKGLEDAIGLTYVHPTWQYTNPGEDEHRGWVFGSKNGKPLSSTAGAGSFPSSWGDEDPNIGAKTIRDIYESVNDTTERYILPILWDKKLKTIVSNESSEIIRMLNLEFNDYASNPDLDLYPTAISEKIDAMNQWIYPSFNNGVYRCGLASTQECYDAAIDELTEAFDKIDSILQKQRYIAGDTFTEADVRLFVTLIRFDEVYDIYFKTNTRSVSNTPAVLNYVREIYQMKNVAKTCEMDMIKAHYYTSHVELNKYSIIPRGVNFIGLLDKPHNRESLS